MSHEPLVECVPNFSEGRNGGYVEQIIAAMSVDGVRLLDYSLDRDHNRSVVTIAGPPEAVVESAVRGVGKAAQLIDLTQQSGVHPRIGAADVIPFVPVRGISLAQCAVLARQAGMQIWRRYGVPVYFYGAAATRPDRVELESLRKGQFEGLRDLVRRDSSRAPDVGGPELHGTAGASVVGARPFLIAYNVYLSAEAGSASARERKAQLTATLPLQGPGRLPEHAGPEIAAARAIARELRASSGGLLGIKALGVMIDGRAQVTINVTDYRRTSMVQLYRALGTLATKHHVYLAEGELIGLVPEEAVEDGAEWVAAVPEFEPSRKILERRLESPMSWPTGKAAS